MATSGKATLHGLFSLQEDATLETFLPALEAYLRQLQAAGYVLRWRVEQRKVLGHFDRGLPDFTHYIAIAFPDLAHDDACYQYVSGRTEPVHALHVAMYQQVQAGARFFLTYEPTSQQILAQGRYPVVEEQDPRRANAQHAKGETPASLHGQGHCAA